MAEVAAEEVTEGEVAVGRAVGLAVAEGRVVVLEAEVEAAAMADLAAAARAGHP